MSIGGSGLSRQCRTGVFAALLLSIPLAGCLDQKEPVAPSGHASMDGIYAVAADPDVRDTPYRLIGGENNRVWFKVTNSSSVDRSYWFGGGVVGNGAQLAGTNNPITIPAGKSRFAYVDVLVSSTAVDGDPVTVYFSANDQAGTSYGSAATSLAAVVNTTHPAVGFISESNYQFRDNGEVIREVRPGELRNLRLWVKNQAGTWETVCARWLPDEGYYGQTETPQGNTCLYLPPHHAGEMNFAFKVKSTASVDATDRQTVVVYTTSDPNNLTYGYLRTVTVGGAPQQFQKFYAWSLSGATLGNRHGIPIQVLDRNAAQEREFYAIAVNGTDLPWDAYGSQPVTSHAAAHPGRLWIVGDEPDQTHIRRVPASEYADMYHKFVEAVRGVDPSARFSPAGFAQVRNNGEPGVTHGVDYAEEFVQAYRTTYHEDPPVAEWRFHAMNMDNATWQAEVKSSVEWAQRHGAPTVIGSVQSVDMAAVMGYVKDQSSWLYGTGPNGSWNASGWITSMGWWTYDWDAGQVLVDGSGNLNARGCEFVWQSQGRIGENCPAR